MKEKIGVLGESNWTQTIIAEANDYAKAHDLLSFSVFSPHFSFAEQVAPAWIFNQKLNIFAAVSSTDSGRIESNLRELSVDLTDAECKYLNLQVDKL